MRSEPIPRSLLHSLHLVFMKMQTLLPRLPTNLFLEAPPQVISNKICETNPGFRSTESQLDCLFIHINPIFPLRPAKTNPCATQRTSPDSASRAQSDDGGRTGNLPRAHTSVVSEAFPISSPQPTQLLPLRCGLSCKLDLLNAFPAIA